MNDDNKYAVTDYEKYVSETDCLTLLCECLDEGIGHENKGTELTENKDTEKSGGHKVRAKAALKDLIGKMGKQEQERKNYIKKFIY